MKIQVFIDENPLFHVGDDFYDVRLYFKGMKLKKKVAYITKDSEYVWIYHGKLKDQDENTLLPGWYNNDGTIYKVPPGDDVKEEYSIDQVFALNLDSIFNDVEKHRSDFLRPEDIETINNNSEVFTPTVKDDDDFLKYLIKRIIIEKKINLKNYKKRFPNSYALTNMKSSLTRKTKMTVTNFKYWCEILGIKWKMEVFDSGEDEVSPLPEPIEINSNQFN